VILLKFVIRGEISHNDVQVMAQVFFHHLPFELVEEVPNFGLCLAVERSGAGDIAATLYDSGDVIFRHEAKRSDEITKVGKNAARPVALAIYEVLSNFTGYRPPWGLLTGIRPAKLISAMYSRGFSREQAVSQMMAQYFVDEDRAALCADIAAAQGRIMATSVPNSVSIYISIAFCPTICDYCSFSAYPLAKFGNRMDAYMAALTKEIAHLGRISRNCYVENIYIGGGTPTALDYKNFGQL
jgi:oxygen-independent coproporphyrinogen-3 oxidase